MRFLVHFVGDVHQPLHAAELYSSQFPQGDRGGNSFPIAGFNWTKELHALWDAGLGQWVDDPVRPLNDTGRAWLASEAAAVMAANPLASLAREVAITAPAAWANESYAIADTFVYTCPQAPTPIPAAYIAQGQAIALTRVALGGYRLATLLQFIFHASGAGGSGSSTAAAQRLLRGGAAAV